MKKINRDTEAELVGSDNAACGNVNKAYHDFYDGERSYEESFEEYFDAEYNADLIEIVWGARPPYTLLDCGSANGLTLAEFAKLGIDAWGVENSAYMYAKTAPEWRAKNLLGDVCELPFPENRFDFLYDTSLCYVPPDKVETAMREMARVCRKGIFFGGITTDMTTEVIERHDLFYNVATLCTGREWSEKFLRNGWRIAIVDPNILARAWKCECDANTGDLPWYPSPGVMRYCFYTKL